MNFNFDSLMDTISNLRERGAEYANAAMDKTKDAARLAKLTVSLTGEKDARSTRASKRCRRRSTRSRARST